MGSVAVSIEKLGKRYRISHQRDSYGRLTESLASMMRAPVDRIRGRTGETQEWLWALRDITLDIEHGDVVGIIGRNGAGKSTLLKVLSQITEPTTGEARLYGRVASLLEVGTGFHPELTGRENIYLSGSILGMRREEIQRRFDEIVEFAEVERFLDTPVKRYSSGMAVRLGFAVAAHLETEILIVDEVLSVGDADFQKKSLGRLHDSAESGRTVLFVSHNLGAMADLTTRCMLLDQGEVRSIGPTSEVIDTYLSQRHETESGTVDFGKYRRDSRPDSPVTVCEVSATDGRRRRLGAVPPLVLQGTLASTRQMDDLDITLIIRDEQGRPVAVLHSPDDAFHLSCPEGLTRFAVEVGDLSLSPGRYFVDVGVNRGVSQVAYDVLVDVPLIEVVNEGDVTHWTERPWGAVHPRHSRWTREHT